MVQSERSCHKEYTCETSMSSLLLFPSYGEDYLSFVHATNADMDAGAMKLAPRTYLSWLTKKDSCLQFSKCC